MAAKHAGGTGEGRGSNWMHCCADARTGTSNQQRDQEIRKALWCESLGELHTVSAGMLVVSTIGATTLATYVDPRSSCGV